MATRACERIRVPIALTDKASEFSALFSMHVGGCAYKYGSFRRYVMWSPRSYGLMDKAPVYGTGDSRFDPW